MGRGSLLGKTTGHPPVYRWFGADPAEMTHSSSSYTTVLFSLAVQSILYAIVLLHRSSLLHPLSSLSISVHCNFVIVLRAYLHPPKPSHTLTFNSFLKPPVYAHDLRTSHTFVAQKLRFKLHFIPNIHSIMNICINIQYVINNTNPWDNLIPFLALQGEGVVSTDFPFLAHYLHLPFTLVSPLVRLFSAEKSHFEGLIE